MNNVSKWLISINRQPHLEGRKLRMATPVTSYGKPAWFIRTDDGHYFNRYDPIFTDEDGLNEATTITEYAKNLGYYDYT